MHFYAILSFTSFFKTLACKTTLLYGTIKLILCVLYMYN